MGEAKRNLSYIDECMYIYKLIYIYRIVTSVRNADREVTVYQ